MAIKDTYSVREVSEVVGFSAETVRRHIRAGRLQAAGDGGTYRVSRAELERWWASLGGGQLFAESGSRGSDSPIDDDARRSDTD